jgi:hypothetical protein
MKMIKVTVCIALTVLAMMATGRAQSFLTNGLVAYYPLNGDVSDASGNGNNGTAFNLVPTTGNLSLANSALYFNGSNGYAAVPNSATLNISNMTLSAWIKPDVGFSDQSFIFDKHQNGVNSDGSWCFQYWGGAEVFGPTFTKTSVGVVNGVWNHLVFTLDNTTGNYAFYLNGQPFGNGTGSFNIQSNALPLYLGAQFTGGGSPDLYYKGAMDKLRVYKRALSSNEVAQLYAFDNAAPLFTQNLTNSFVVNSSNFVFNVSVSSPTPVTYQWYFNNGSGSGGSQAGGYAQTISGLVYNVIVTNGGSGYGYVPPVSFVGGNPSTPAGGVAVVSNGVVTGVTITNAGIGYGSVPTIVFGLPDGYIAGQTTNFLALSNASAANAGNYYVVATSSYGSVTSSVVSLTLLYPPTVTNNPAGFQAALHGSGTLQVGVSGTAPFSYQWLLNGTNVAGANSSSYPINNLTLNSAGSYAVLVTNSYGSVTSAPAIVELLPSLTSPFTGDIALWGQDTILSVGAIGSGTLNYQWYFNGAAIGGATGSTYEFNSIQFTNAGLYSVVVSSQYGSTTNTAYQVVVNPANVLITTPPNVVIQGTIGYSYTIQSTTNLADTNAWITETNITLTQPIQNWTDYSIDISRSGYSGKFYRVLADQ